MHAQQRRRVEAFVPIVVAVRADVVDLAVGEVLARMALHAVRLGMTQSTISPRSAAAESSFSAAGVADWARFPAMRRRRATLWRPRPVGSGPCMVSESDFEHRAVRVFLPAVPGPRRRLGDIRQWQHRFKCKRRAVVLRVHRDGVRSALPMARMAAIPLVEAAAGVVRKSPRLAALSDGVSGPPSTIVFTTARSCKPTIWTAFSKAFATKTRWLSCDIRNDSEAADFDAVESLIVGQQRVVNVIAGAAVVVKA